MYAPVGHASVPNATRWPSTTKPSWTTATSRPSASTTLTRTVCGSASDSLTVTLPPDGFGHTDTATEAGTSGSSSDSDHHALTVMLAATPDGWGHGPAGARRRTLERAVVVPSRDVPSHVITMGSRFTLQDPVTGAAAPCTLVYPRDDGPPGHVSILSPAGVALLGRSEQDVVEWTVTATTERTEVRVVTYQPGAADAFWTRAAPHVWEV